MTINYNIMNKILNIFYQRALNRWKYNIKKINEEYNRVFIIRGDQYIKLRNIMYPICERILDNNVRKYILSFKRGEIYYNKIPRMYVYSSGYDYPYGYKKIDK